jgi:CheY-like chemotaxis protein
MTPGASSVDPGYDSEMGRAGSPDVDACRKVYVVEDDSELRHTLGEALEAQGYRVVATANGAEALAALRSDDARPCLILLDLMMPVMNGYEFRKEQRADPALAGIPVVVISAHARNGFDADAFLPKPVALRRLLAVIARYCG